MKVWLVKPNESDFGCDQYETSFNSEGSHGYVLK